MLCPSGGDGCRDIGNGPLAETGSKSLPIKAISFTALVCAALPLPAAAWGSLGHQVVAMIAYDHLTPVARKQVDSLLAADADTLTPPDFASRSVWADQYRNSHRETAAWHFADVEIDKPDLDAACFGFPKLPSGQLASQGPAKDCVVNKIEQFQAELAAPQTPQAERLLALKFLIHFVGDLHQPLHAADHDDKGGNCVRVEADGDHRMTNLHAYWDTGVLEPLGASPVAIAVQLEADITPGRVKAWSAGNTRAWAMESFAVAKTVVYDLPSRPTCDEHGGVTLSSGYRRRAEAMAREQVEKAGVRLAGVLSEALAN